MTARCYTCVTTLFVRDRVNVRLRFARPAGERGIDRHQRLILIAPDSLFALLRWEHGPYGTILSDMAVMRAVAPGEACAPWPHVRPGAEILLCVSGWHIVERALEAIDDVEAHGVDPADAAPDYWRHVHNRLRVRQAPHPYSTEQHCAWLRRRELLS